MSGSGRRRPGSSSTTTPPSALLGFQLSAMAASSLPTRTRVPPGPIRCGLPSAPTPVWTPKYRTTGSYLTRYLLTNSPNPSSAGSWSGLSPSAVTTSGVYLVSPMAVLMSRRAERNLLPPSQPYRSIGTSSRPASTAGAAPTATNTGRGGGLSSSIRTTTPTTTAISPTAAAPAFSHQPVRTGGPVGRSVFHFGSG
ncbi:MAG: hypothetical protein U0871_24580 [Gemmataceae bacterium]